MVHGPLGLVLLDAHADVWDRYVGERLYHGSPFRRAVEEGLLDPGRSLLAGMRGSLYCPEDSGMPEDLGFHVIECDELVTLTPDEYAARVAPAWGTGRCSSRSTSTFSTPPMPPARERRSPVADDPKAFAYVRSLRGLRFSGYDVVEVSSPFDGRGTPTAIAAANVAYELLTLTSSLDEP